MNILENKKVLDYLEEGRINLEDKSYDKISFRDDKKERIAFRRKIEEYFSDINKKLTDEEIGFLIYFISTETQKELSPENKLFKKYEKEKDKILKVQELTLKFIEENYNGQEHDKLIKDTSEIVSQSLIRLDKECVEETGKALIEKEREEETL